MDTEASRKLYKVVVVGEKGSGKTSFVKRYTGGVFHPRYKETIGVDYGVKKSIDEKTGEEIHVQFWDISGLERGTATAKSAYEGANGIVVVCDVSNLAGSQQTTVKWMLDIAESNPDRKDIAYVTVFTKSDLCVDQDMKPFTAAGMFFVSAKNGYCVDEAMNCLISQMNARSAFTIEQIPVQKRKICFVGDLRVGKTSIIKRYQHGVFSTVYKPTIGMQTTSSQSSNEEGKLFETVFADVGGQELTGMMTKHYYRVATAFVIVADFTNEQSLKNVQNWIMDFQLCNSAPFRILINKTDEKCSYVCTKAVCGLVGTYGTGMISFVSAKDDNRSKEIKELIDAL